MTSCTVLLANDDEEFFLIKSVVSVVIGAAFSIPKAIKRFHRNCSTDMKVDEDGCSGGDDDDDGSIMDEWAAG